MVGRALRGLRDLGISLAVFSSAAYGYFYFRSQANQQRYLQSIKSQTLRDASRLSNDSFGISWGFQADDTIMSRIDSGDLLFLKYACEECLTPEAMVRCYWSTAHFLEEETHSLGCAYRDQTNLYVLYNEFGETRAKTYCQLVSLPYIRELTLQKRERRLQMAHRNLSNEVELEKARPEGSLEFARRIGRLLGFPSVQSIDDFASGEQRINIRTDTNRKLSSL